MDDEVFLRAILQKPDDDSALLIYADWLEEKNDPNSLAKAEFLRLTVTCFSEKTQAEERESQRDRLQQLAKKCDPNWLALVSRLPVENCLENADDTNFQDLSLHPIRFRFLCSKRWHQMQLTDDNRIRFCTGCEKNVYYCQTIDDARDHACRNECVVLFLGIKRSEHDLMVVQTIGDIEFESDELDIYAAEPSNNLSPTGERWYRKLWKKLWG